MSRADRLWLSFSVVSLVFAAGVGPVEAQAPVISSTSPQAVKPGSTVNVTIRGTNLAGATSLWTSFPAKAVLAPKIKNNGKNATSVVFRISVPANAEAGIQAIRLTTAQGISRLKLFAVDDLPSVAQKAGNNTPATAQVVNIPVAVDGTIAALTRNYYKFKAIAGQTLSFEVLARRFGSPLDPMIRIFALTEFGPSELKYSDDAPGLSGDSQLSYKFSKTGEYLIEVRDIRYQGGGTYRYRLRMGDFPCVTVPYPMGVTRGKQTTLRFGGSDVDNVPPRQFVAGKSTGSRAVVVAAKRKSGSSSGFATITVSDAVEFLEKEPNNSVAQANRTMLTSSFNGRFDVPDDVDRFLFKAKKGQRVTFTAVTRSQGSPSDLIFRITDAKGKKLVEVEDSGTNDGILTYTFPADGDYQCVVEDLHHRGGSPYVYRIQVKAATAGFRLTAATDHVNVPAGGTAGFTVKVIRQGYNGPVKVVLEGLPAGLVSVPTVIGPGRNSAVVTVSGSTQAKPGVSSAVRLVGTGTVGKTTVTAVADISAALKASGGMLWPPTNLADSFAVGVAPKSPAALQATPGMVSVARGKTVKVKISVKRGAGITEALVLKLSPLAKKNPDKGGLPAGLSIAVKPIAKGKNVIELVITATKKAPKGIYTATLIATHKKGKATKVFSVPGITITVQ